MSLLVWLPLISDTNNRGLSNPTITTTGTIAYNAGKIGNALTFSNSAITLKPAPLTTSTKEFSFAFWFKPTSTNTYQCLYNGRTSVGGAIAVFRDPSNLWRLDDGTQRTFNFGTVVNEWHHYVFTRDESNVRLYIDGILKQTMTSSSFTCDTASASIGMSSTSNTTPSSNPIIGQVNDYRIYNHVLSVKEIKELAKGLCIHLPLDWGGNTNILPDSPVVANPTETDSTLGRTVYVRSTTATSESHIWGGRSDVVEQSTKYTLSAWVWVNEYVKSVEVFWLSTNTTNKKTGTAYDSVTVKSAWTQTPNTWQYVTWTFTTKADDYTGVIRWDNNGSSTSGTAAILKVCNMKVEKGEIATPYIPHSSDTIYATEGFASRFAEECSGLKKATSILSAPINGGTSPRGCSCTYFDGIDDGIQIDESAMYQIISDKFTLSFWIKPDGEAGARSVYFGSNGNTCYNISIEKKENNQLRFYWNNGSPDYNNTAFIIADNTWQHIAIVRESATSHKFYKNGALVNTYTTSCAAQTTASPNFYIGRDQRTGTTCYKGYMSDFRLYASALSADDIKELYQISAQIDKSGNMYCNTFVEV